MDNDPNTSGINNPLGIIDRIMQRVGTPMMLPENVGAILSKEEVEELRKFLIALSELGNVIANGSDASLGLLESANVDQKTIETIFRKFRQNDPGATQNSGDYAAVDAFLGAFNKEETPTIIIDAVNEDDGFGLGDISFGTPNDGTTNDGNGADLLGDISFNAPADTHPANDFSIVEQPNEFLITEQPQKKSFFKNLPGVKKFFKDKEGSNTPNNPITDLGNMLPAGTGELQASIVTHLGQLQDQIKKMNDDRQKAQEKERAKDKLDRRLRILKGIGWVAMSPAMLVGWFFGATFKRIVIANVLISGLWGFGSNYFKKENDTTEKWVYESIESTAKTAFVVPTYLVKFAYNKGPDLVRNLLNIEETEDSTIRSEEELEAEENNEESSLYILPNSGLENAPELTTEFVTRVEFVNDSHEPANDALIMTEVLEQKVG